MRLVNRKSRKNQSGQAFVESGLVMLIFLPVLIGVMDFGQFLYLHLSLTERTRAAAHYGSITTYTDGSDIANVAIYNDPAGAANGATALLPNLQTTDSSHDGYVTASLTGAGTDDAVGVSISIDQTVNPTTGDKNKEVKAFNDRAAQDTDNTSLTYANYAGNSRRLITVVVNNGWADSAGVAYPANQQTIGLGYAQFLLLRDGDYSQGGGSNNPWCAIYVGPSPAVDTSKTGGGGTRGKGVGVVRLTN